MSHTGGGEGHNVNKCHIGEGGGYKITQKSARYYLYDPFHHHISCSVPSLQTTGHFGWSAKFTDFSLHFCTSGLGNQGSCKVY